jgi:predicted nucleic acid-binding protein
MIRVLLDTNVVLDALLSRAPWNADAEAFFEANHRGQLEAHLTATALTDVFYVARRLTDRARAWRAVGTCLDQFFVLPVGVRELRAAASGSGDDFEDNLQIACAILAGLDAIVTRDPKGFAGSPVPVVTPAELLAQIPKGDDAGR